MGLLSSVRAKRTDRKAGKKIRKGEEKAIKYRAKAQAKAESAVDRKLRKKELRTEDKFHKRAQKAERKTTKTASKAQRKVAEAEAKIVSEQAKADAAKALFTPAKMKRFLTVGRMAAPVVVPIVYRGAVAARAQLTEIQARRAGVPAQVLTQFGGPSAALRARIATSRDSATKVAAAEQTAEGKAFVDAMTDRLANLEVAADAADAMPPAQRKSAQRAIDNELTAIDNDLLARLNVHPT
ncbi:DUF6474 family protein [Gordonia sp. HY285]|uniref:DUF6474 family protein n=1 Tax=Gordonia liuliyuniae TaxID=2911517 RepID=UPI001F256B39|nr:DUF6474 family protein [Gordonia liuliyuniae]MCF8608876.1 DUF6474 family protein [Gordonia liuliyuniae]